MTEPDGEEQMKAVLPFLKRADEIKVANPKMAYYCRLYALEQAMRFQKRDKALQDLIKSVFNQLEHDKPGLHLDPENDKLLCEAFALDIFHRADRVDQAGRADINTSKAFYVASYFLEVLNQFNDVQPDMLKKQAYAAYRAAEIRKALREGRPPVPSETAAATISAGVPPVAPEDQLPPAASGGSALANLPGLPPLVSGSGGSSTATDWPRPAAPPSVALSGARSSGPTSSVVTTTLPPPPAGSYGARSRGPSGAGAPAPLQRFAQGSQVLVLDGDSNGRVEPGTVGQVLKGPGMFWYKVALRDRLVEVPDASVAPLLSEGARVAFYTQPNRPPVQATVVQVNDSDWPPTFTVQTEDGFELPAESHQLSLTEVLLPEPTHSHASSGTHSSGEYPRILPLGVASGSPSGALPPSPFVLAAAGPAPAQRQPSPRSPPRQQTPPPALPPAPCQVSPPPPPRQAPSRLVPPPPAHSLPVSAAPKAVAGYTPPLQAITAAHKAAKYAVSALAFEDTSTAVKYLQEALRVLTQP